MPLITITTSTKICGKEVINFITTETSKIFNIAPDKIICRISDISDTHIGRGGITLSDPSFSSKSRVTNSSKNTSYFNEEGNRHENMIIIEYNIWKGNNTLTKEELSAKITNYLKNTYLIPGDNILLIFRDMPHEDWMQNGTNGADPLFLQKSRTYSLN